MIEPKPKVEAAEVEVLMVYPMRPVRAIVRWGVSCGCHGTRYLAVVPSWDAALEIALLHGRLFHDA